MATPRYAPNWNRRIMAVEIAMVLGIILFTATAWYISCRGQCGHGNRRCQERCLNRGECPYEVGRD